MAPCRYFTSIEFRERWTTAAVVLGFHGNRVSDHRDKTGWLETTREAGREGQTSDSHPAAVNGEYLQDAQALLVVVVQDGGLSSAAGPGFIYSLRRPVPQPPVEEAEQPEDPRRSPPPDEEEPPAAAAADPVPELKPGPEAGEADEDAPAGRGQPPRSSPTFQKNPTLYSKRLAGYRHAPAKDVLWTGQARQMKRTPNELKTWYDNTSTKLGELKKTVTESVQAADHFTATERQVSLYNKILNNICSDSGGHVNRVSGHRGHNGMDTRQRGKGDGRSKRD
ncbi:hypothetical protein ScPMuIL_017925 [Solemya velum]